MLCSQKISNFLNFCSLIKKKNCCFLWTRPSDRCNLLQVNNTDMKYSLTFLHIYIYMYMPTTFLCLFLFPSRKHKKQFATSFAFSLFAIIIKLHQHSDYQKLWMIHTYMYTYTSTVYEFSQLRPSTWLLRHLIRRKSVCNYDIL